MTQKTNTTEHVIDATGRKLGRLSSEIAVQLMGKNRTDFAPHIVAPVRVLVQNASKLDMDQKKKDTTEYQRYSGYPGGRKVRTASEVIDRKGYGELIRIAVKGMLPKNKLQTPRMKNLIIEE